MHGAPNHPPLVGYWYYLTAEVITIEINVSFVMDRQNEINIQTMCMLDNLIIIITII